MQNKTVKPIAQAQNKGGVNTQALTKYLAYWPIFVLFLIGALVGACRVTTQPLGSGGRELPQAVNKPPKAGNHRNSAANNHNNRLKTLQDSTL